MADLTTTQMLVLTSACERDDGIATRPDTLNRSAAAKVAAKLLERGLLQERRAKAGWPVWRIDGEGKAFSLKILKQGRAIAMAATSKTAVNAPALLADAETGEAGGVVQIGETGQLFPHDRPKGGAKRTLILALMRRKDGATMSELTFATGWLPHTTRAALSGLRKDGIAVQLAKGQSGAASTYKVEMPVAAAA